MWDISDIQMALEPVFDKFGISSAVLFGSVAKGTATEKSDLDLLVDSNLRGLRFVGFMEAVHQAVGMPVWEIISEDIPELQRTLQKMIS